MGEDPILALKVALEELKKDMRAKGFVQEAWKLGRLLELISEVNMNPTLEAYGQVASLGAPDELKPMIKQLAKAIFISGMASLL